ncbi:MAG: DUF6152 family protein [Gammaproteobacteria bacterium]|nr:DUF6152 family protein [Gammaproteobacteria bacterium]
MRRINIGFVAVLSLALGPAMSLAHHSFAAVFDAESPIELTGTVTSVEWMNPHAWFYMDVENDAGEVENWALEMGSPNHLRRRGWNRNSLQVGDVITVAGSRARDGSTKGAVRTVTLDATGESLFGGQDESR